MIRGETWYIKHEYIRANWIYLSFFTKTSQNDKPLHYVKTRYCVYPEDEHPFTSQALYTRLF